MRLLILAAGAGSRLRGESGGLPKQLLEVGGRTLLAHQLELAAALGLAPVVVTRPAAAPLFGAVRGVEVVTVGPTAHMLDTLYEARHTVDGDFAWVGGDTVIAATAPLAAALRGHLVERRYATFLRCRGERHLAKWLPGRPVPRVTLTRQGAFGWSLPNFGIQRADSFADLALVPRGEYVQRALDRGEAVAFVDYAEPLFEIDTPRELALARQHFAPNV